MKLTANGTPLPPLHPTAPAHRPIDLSHPRLAALMNVAVFTPYAIYLARGKMPPTWLIAASLAWTGLQFFGDLNYLMKGEESTLSGCNCR